MEILIQCIFFLFQIFFFCFSVKQIEPIALFRDHNGTRDNHSTSSSSVITEPEPLIDNKVKLNQQTVPCIKRKGKRAKEIKIYPAIRQQENTEQQLPTNTPYISKKFQSRLLPLEVPDSIISDLANPTVGTNNFITTTPKRPESSDVDEPSLKRK